MDEIFRGRTDLAVTTSDRPRDATVTATPTRGAPLPPTQETSLTDTVIDGIIRTRKIDEPPKTKRNKLAVKLGLTGAGLLALAGGVWGVSKVLSEDNTSLTTQSQTIDSPNSFNMEFDKSTTKGEITTHNSIVLDNTEALRNLSPTPSGPNPEHDIYLLTPRLGPPPEDGIDYRKDLTGKNASNPIYSPEVRQYAIEKGVNNKIFIKVTRGEEIPVPVPGQNVEFMYDRIRNDIPEGTVDSATFFYMDDTNTLHQVRVSDSSGKPLAPTMPNIKPRGIKDDYTNFLHPNEIGAPVLRALEDGEVVMFAQAWPSGQAGVGNVYPTNINLIGSADLSPSDASNKAVLLDKPAANTQ